MQRSRRESMKALAEQIAELDEVEIYGRVVGVRGLLVEVAGPIHAMSVGARVMIEAGGSRAIPCEVVGFTGPNALLMPFAPLEGVRRGCRASCHFCCGCGAAIGRLARPRRQRDGRADRRQGPAAARAVALSVPQCAAARACAPPRRRAARSRRARAQHIPHLLPRPAHGRVRGLGRRQIGAALDAGAQRRGRRVGDRARRRARPRGAGVPAGRSRRGGPRALGRRRLDLGRTRADAPPGRLSHARDRGIFPRRGTRTCWC